MKVDKLGSEEHIDSTTKLVEAIKQLDRVSRKSLVQLMKDGKVPLDVAVPTLHRTGGDKVLEEIGIELPIKPVLDDGFLLAAHEVMGVVSIITMDPYDSNEYPYRVCVWVNDEEWMDSVSKLYAIAEVPFLCVMEQAGRDISFPMILARMVFEEWAEGPEEYTNVKLELEPCGILDFRE